MAAAGLPWYNEAFPRSGSSGLVWEDRFLPGEQPAPLVFDNRKAAADDDDKEQKRDEGDGGDGCQRGKQARTDRRPWKALTIPRPMQEPPSPRVSVCCFCGFLFGKPKKKPRPTDDDNVDGCA